jgi:hypothetical protein
VRVGCRHENATLQQWKNKHLMGKREGVGVGGDEVRGLGGDLVTVISVNTWILYGQTQRIKNISQFCTSRVRMHCPLTTSHTLTVPSSDDEARYVPSCEKASACTQPSCDRHTWSERPVLGFHRRTLLSHDPEACNSKNNRYFEQIVTMKFFSERACACIETLVWTNQTPIWREQWIVDFHKRLTCEI